MKTNTLSKMIVALAVIFGLGTAFGQVQSTQDQTSPATLSVGGASAGVTPGRLGPTLMSDPAPAQVKIMVQPALLPAQNSPGCWDVIGLAQEEFLAGNWRSATSYKIITNGLIRWQDLVYGEDVATPWGTTLQWITIIKAVDGTDSISLAMFRSKATSTGGALNSSYQAGTGGYSTVVYGRKANGQLVIDGPPEQLVAELVITTQMAAFNGGATPAGLDEVKNHVNGWVDYTIRFEASMTCDVDTIGKAKVSTVGFAGIKPRLQITKEKVTIDPASGDAERPYNIVRRPLVDNGTWTTVATRVYLGDETPAQPGFYTVAFWP
jgi:hypothetical protein